MIKLNMDQIYVFGNHGVKFDENQTLVTIKSPL